MAASPGYLSAFFAGLAIGLLVAANRRPVFRDTPSSFPAGDVDPGELELWKPSGPARPGSDAAVLLGYDTKRARLERWVARGPSTSSLPFSAGAGRRPA